MLAFYFLETEEIRKEASTGAAWLSSACTVRRTLKWVNKRNPHPVLNFTGNCPLKAWRKVRMTSSQHGPYVLGYTHPTMGVTAGLQRGNVKLIPETRPQFRLKAAIRLHEVEIASNRGSAGRGEYVLRSCTHRPSSQQSRECLKPSLFWARGQ